MEAMGAEGQWTSLSGVYTAEEADFMALLLNNQLSSAGTTLQNFWPPHESSSSSSSTIMNNNYCSLELINSNSNLCPNFSRGTSATTSSSAYSGGNNNCIINVFPTSPSDDHLSSDDNKISQPTTHSFDFFLAGDLKTISNHYLVHNDDDDRLSSEENGSGGREAFAAPDQKAVIKVSSDQAGLLLEDNKRSSSEKRPRSCEKVEVGKKYAKSKKKQKLVSTTSETLVHNEEGGNNNGFGANNGQSSSSTTCCSGDESINGGQEMSGGDTLSCLSPKQPNSTLNSDGKARARRGSATDPQSLYARKRRERINERLKILQTLVPNGTKVDISTMLEEAVQYVKFLQLQIKLLSSDELWMYAPIAYNGKDIGLDHLKLISLAKK